MSPVRGAQSPATVLPGAVTLGNADSRRVPEGDRGWGALKTAALKTAALKTAAPIPVARGGDLVREPAPPAMAWVLGVDPSLRRTGLAAVAHTAGACTPHTWVAATDSPRVDSVDHRVRRLEGLRRQVLQVLTRLSTPPVLALVEAPIYGSPDAGAHENAGAWWSIVTALVQAGVPVGTCAPATRAKWATGKGNADKAAVVAAMAALWPDVGCTQNVGRHNECDALVLSTMAAQHLGWPVPIRGWHGASLEVVRWPTIPAVTHG